MQVRLGIVGLLATAVCGYAGDGIPTRASAADYPAHAISGKLEIGAAYVSRADAKRILGDDMEKKGFLVFEVGVFPVDDASTDLSADDFKLRVGKDTSVIRAVMPDDIGRVTHPPKGAPKIPENVSVHGSETIGYETGPYGHGVYTGTAVGVGVDPKRSAPLPPPPTPSSGADDSDLRRQIALKALPEGKTNRNVAGYVFFQKPDAKGDFTLLYFGMDGQVSLKLPAAK